MQASDQPAVNPVNLRESGESACGQAGTGR